MALIQINRDVSDPAATLQPGELWLNLTNGRLWGGTSGGNALLLDPTGGTGPFLPLVGGTITGPLVLPGNATAPLQAMPLQQLDTAQNNIGRNLLHNPLFNVAQRGTGPFTAQGYTLDRWWQYVNLDTISVTQGSLSDANRAQIGDEAASVCYYNTFTGNAGAASYNFAVQRIEGVRRLAGKTVTVSFWACTSVGTLKLGVSVDQLFGTGGSPSAAVTGNGTAVTLSTTLTRYTMSFTLASVAGKTLGTNGDSFTALNLWFSSGATQAVRAGSVGVQSGAIALWGVQLEIGSVATPLEKPDPQQDLAKCQRFFFADGPFSISFYSWGAGAYGVITMPYPTTMRTTPTVVLGASSANTNVASVILSATTQIRTQIVANAVAGGGSAITMATFSASADL